MSEWYSFSGTIRDWRDLIPEIVSWETKQAKGIYFSWLSHGFGKRREKARQQK